jgi:hypothetical protein
MIIGHIMPRRTHLKPRMRQLRTGIWKVWCGEVTRMGNTDESAYLMWKQAKQEAARVKLKEAA